MSSGRNCVSIMSRARLRPRQRGPVQDGTHEWWHLSRQLQRNAVNARQGATPMSRIAFLAAAVLMLPTPVLAEGPVSNGTQLNGTQLNDISANGRSAQGTSLNGQRLDNPSLGVIEGMKVITI